MAWRMRRDEDTARDSDSPQAASRLGFLAVAVASVGGVWACGSPAGSAPAYLFPDASLVDARPRVDATRSPLDAVSTSSDATAPAERGQSRCTPDGGTVTLSTRAFPFDYGIVVDPDAVYFFGLEADAGPQGQIDLRSVKKDGTAETVLTLTNGQSLAEDDTFLYWGGYNPAFETGIYRIAKAGGPAVLLASVNEVDPLSTAVSGASVYWVAGVHEDGSLPDELLAAPLDGGVASVVVPAPVDIGGPGVVGVDAESLYWVQPPGRLYSRPLAGGAPKLLAPQSNVGAFDVDDDAIYFASNDALYSLPKAGGAPVMLAMPVGIPYIAHDATDVYAEEPFENRIVKVSKRGGAVTTVVSGSNVGSAGFAVDSRCVYWLGPGNDGLVPVPLYMAPN